MVRIFARAIRYQDMLKVDFERFKAHQYCDNTACLSYGVVGAKTLITHSIVKGQIRCSACKGKAFSVRKGTMYFGLRTDMSKIVRCLQSLVSGTGQNAVCRNECVDGQTLRSWMVLASAQVTVFTAYLQQELHLSEVQIDEFWSYIKKKTIT